MTTDTFMRIAHEAAFHDAGHGYDEFGLHPPALAAAVAVSRPLYDLYFRVASEGIEHVPARGPAILVANHSGVLPVDAMMLCLDVVRRTVPPRIPRAVMDHFVPQLPWISTLFARCGGVSGTHTNVRHLLERGELVAVWPEGVAGVAKPFRERYRLQRWHVGFAEHALRASAPIVPVAIIGAEESWPLAARIDRFHAFGAPYLPLPMVPFPLPVRYHFHYGEPITLRGDPAVPGDVAAAAELVRDKLQLLVDAARAARGGVFR